MQTPSHYKGDVQPLDIIHNLQLGYNLGCVVKYCFRAGKKEGNSIEQDLNKAISYLQEEKERPNQYVFTKNEAEYQLNISYIDSLDEDICPLLDWVLFEMCHYLFHKKDIGLDSCISIIKKHIEITINEIQ